MLVSSSVTWDTNFLIFLHEVIDCQFPDIKQAHWHESGNPKQVNKVSEVITSQYHKKLSVFGKASKGCHLNNTSIRRYCHYK